MEKDTAGGGNSVSKGTKEEKYRNLWIVSNIYQEESLEGEWPGAKRAYGREREQGLKAFSCFSFGG